jgi:Fur family zinc uptake transcriptional regulator|tara:strand:- start:1652 stop:2143 length:492 start_codon:yes stop_codon:yes gene_type:complete
MASETSKSVGFEKHDHGLCLEKAIKAAEAYCDRCNLQFTPLRRKVLEILLEEHRALGAYAVLDLLREAGLGSQPPVAYRALSFLVEHGFAHKIERLNAFVACALPDILHSPAFMICRKCDTVVEAQSPSSSFDLSETASATGFEIEQTTLEAKGVCNSCAEMA